MAASVLKRVSPTTEATISELAAREDRSFVAQLDRVVAAGLQAMGEDVPDAIAPTVASTPAKPARKSRKAAATSTA
jgi:hypothetical protein